MGKWSGPQDACRAFGSEQRRDHVEAHGHAVWQRRYCYQHNIYMFAHPSPPAELLTHTVPSPDLPLRKVTP